VSKRLRVHWGFGVGAAYLIFAGSTMGFVVFAMAQPVELVSEDYYGRSLVEDARLEATRNADALGAALACQPSPDGRGLLIQIPPAHAAAATGTVTLYRPSSVAADRTVPLALDADGRQRLPFAGLAAGRWTLQLEWQVGSRHFHHEQAIHVP
jgi:hypothetical protein